MNPNLARTLRFRAAQVETETYARTVQEKDNNCCTVDALHILTECPWKDAYDALKSIGRPFRQGLSTYILEPYLELFRKQGFTLTPVSRMEMTGRFLILTTNHAAALVNGKVVNGLHRNSYITHIFRVERG